MSDAINYITPAGLEKLKAEYRQLLSVDRPKVVETVAWAASNGDRSENADYIYGKRRLREIDKRLHFLTKRLESVQVIDPASVQSAQIRFGATVEVEFESGDIRTYFIVGEDETHPESGKISWKSPLARALLGKKADEETQLVKPSGLELLIIVSVNYTAIP